MRKENLVISVVIALITCVSVVFISRAGTDAAGVELDPDRAQQAYPGEGVLYEHTLTNTGSTTDTFAVDVMSTEGWPVELLSGQYPGGTKSLSLELGPDVSAALQVSLTVPIEAAGVADVTVVTATSQLNTTVWDTAVDTTSIPALVYLPLVARRWPPVPDTPVLNPIDNGDGDDAYTVSWNAAYLADEYLLQEDDNATFPSPSIVYSDSGTSDYVSGQPPGTYYYRVKATNAWGESGWSNVEQVRVLPPTATVYVENNTGGELCYEVYDTGIGRKCFSSGTHFYGRFPSGTYTYRVSARCGSLTEEEYYPAGDSTHEFWCQ